MEVRRGLKPFVEPQGLFARKSSSNILSDPRILEHLRIVAEEAQLEEADEDNISEDDEMEFERKELAEKIAAYNKRNQFGAFRVTQNGLDYEGAVRFYFVDGREEHTKAVEISNKTTVEELFPILLDKFHLLFYSSQDYALYVVHDVDEIALDYSDCPLNIAINALKIPRFVLRHKRHQVDDINEEKLTNQISRTSSSSEKVQASSHQNVTTPRSNLKSTPSSSSGDSKPSFERSVTVSSNVSETPSPLVTKGSHKTSNKTKRTKSFSQIASMVRKKKGPEKTESSELSTNKLAPGILKVFGDHVSSGSNYKSVRASTISTAREVVKQALEKYSIENANPNDYVLCDVVGHFKVDSGSKGNEDNEEAQWVTEYMRVVNDNEKPLVVQSLWKPANGRLRRFELIKKIQMEAGCFFINTAENLRTESNLSSPGIDSERSSIISDHTLNEQTLGENSAASTPRTATYATEEYSYTSPQKYPFLLLIKGCDVLLDKLLNTLIKPMIILGNPKKDKSSVRPDICLYASDILAEHCYFHKKISLEKGAHETNIDDINFSIFIEPSPNADVYINGVKIEQLTLLQPGQLVSLGSQYCFVFKDQTQTEEKLLKLSWLDALKQGKSRVSQTETSKINQYVQVDMENSHLEVTTDEVDAALDLADDQSETAIKEMVPRSSVMLTYKYEDEDDLLDKIMHEYDERSLKFKLTPAYLLTMMIQHSCAAFTESHARKLLLKISSALQSVAWEKTKDIGKLSAEKKDDVLEFFNIMLLELAPVVKWMANALEMLHYFQCNLSKHLQCATPSKVRESLVSSDEELLTVLEEVIMFTFQQTVYHLTKVLYSTLPAILDTNPFQSEDEDDDEEAVSTPPGVALIVEIFGKTLSLVKSHDVHPQIITQLFDYLFFFTNASLFNSLMERGAGGKFYKWTKGVQIRGNLDVLEEFASKSGLQEHFPSHMRKIVAAVALLSIPKAQLMSMDWNTIRDDYPDLNASQVQQLLGEYQLGGKGRPRGWYPPPEEVEAALRSSDVLESFATHPPLLLPTTDFVMNLDNHPNEAEFSRILDEIKELHGDTTASPMPKQKTDKRSVSKTSSNSSLVNGHKAANYVVSVQPNMTSTPHRNVVIKDSIEVVKIRSASQTSSSSSTRSDSKTRKANVSEGNADGSDTSDTLEGTPEIVAKMESRHRQPTPLPDKKPNIVIQHDIDFGDNLDSNGEERRSSALGNPHTIQTVQRKGSADGRVSKSNIIYVESTAKINGELDNVNNNKPTEYVKKYIGGESIGDVNFTSNEVDFSNNSDLIDDPNDVFVVELVRGDRGLGLGLIDGLITPLGSPGIYIRTIVSNSPAAKDGRIQLGDRILAVNANSLVGLDYSRAMDMIINAGNKLSFLIAKSSPQTVEKILSSQC